MLCTDATLFTPVMCAGSWCLEGSMGPVRTFACAGCPTWQLCNSGHMMWPEWVFHCDNFCIQATLFGPHHVARIKVLSNRTTRAPAPILPQPTLRS